MRRPKQSTDPHPELGLPEVRRLWQTEGLFSDHYLKKRIQENLWWPSEGDARPIFEFCKALYEKRYLACAKNNEAFTRPELLEKILEKLGFPFSPMEKRHGISRHRDGRTRKGATQTCWPRL